MADTVKDWLSGIQLEQYYRGFISLGASKVEHLNDCEEADLLSLDLKVVHLAEAASLHPPDLKQTVFF